MVGTVPEAITILQMLSMMVLHSSSYLVLIPHCKARRLYLSSLPIRTHIPTSCARAWPTGCIRKTDESILAREEVLDHSAVMTALFVVMLAYLGIAEL